MAKEKAIPNLPESVVVDDNVPQSDSDKLKSLVITKYKGIDKKNRKAAIFTHAVPDPDAISAQVALRYMLSLWGIDATCFVDGDISHPQNKIAVQLLDPHLISVSKYNVDDFALNFLVDTVPKHAGTGDYKVDFDVVIDHHKELPDESFKGLCIHHHSGSCAGLVYGLMQEQSVNLDANDDEQVKVATAILVGVMTDTDHCTKPDTTVRDFRAQQAMFGIADFNSLRSIVRFEWPSSWVKLLGIAITDHEMYDGIAVVGLGILKGEQYDAVAAIADTMLLWNNVKIAVVFAYFDDNYVSGCLRTNDNTIEVHSLCAELGGEYGEGGGKSLAGRYTKPLGAFSFEFDEDRAIIARWWDIQREREVKKILRLLNK